MPFHFNPSLWFVCKLCREAFSDTDKLKAHKLESHLGESLNIKCIVFEENPLDHEWTPPLSPELGSKQNQHVNSNDARASHKINDGIITSNVKATIAATTPNNPKKMKFKNPYVSLKTLTAQDLNLNYASSPTKESKSPSPAVAVGSTSNLKFKDATNKLLDHRNRNSTTEEGNCCFPDPAKKPTIFEEKLNDDNDHQNKIRKLIKNVVIIKSEPSTINSNNLRMCVEPQAQPQATHLMPLNSCSASSKLINQVEGNVSFNSLQLQHLHPLQLLLQENSETILPSDCNTINDPFNSQIRTSFLLKPQEATSYPRTLGDTGTGTGIGQPTRSKNKIVISSRLSSFQNEINNVNKFNTHEQTDPSQTEITRETSSLKVEFIDYDLIASQNPEIVSYSYPVSLSSNGSEFPPVRVQDQPGGSHYDYCYQQETKNFTNFNESNSNFELPAPISATSKPRRTLVKKTKMHKPYVCQICFATFGRSHHLTQHRLVHSNHKAVPCPHCPSKFKTKSNLRGHLISCHGHPSSFRCQFCSKFFASKADLITHETFHTGERPYKCDFPNCGAQYTNRHTVYTHKRMAHGENSGLKQFECPTCGKMFGLRNLLKIHQNQAHATDLDVQILSSYLPVV